MSSSNAACSDPERLNNKLRTPSSSGESQVLPSAPAPFVKKPNKYADVDMVSAEVFGKVVFVIGTLKKKERMKILNSLAPMTRLKGTRSTSRYG